MCRKLWTLRWWVERTGSSAKYTGWDPWGRHRPTIPPVACSPGRGTTPFTPVRSPGCRCHRGLTTTIIIIAITTIIIHMRFFRTRKCPCTTDWSVGSRHGDLRRSQVRKYANDPRNEISHWLFMSIFQGTNWMVRRCRSHWRTGRGYPLRTWRRRVSCKRIDWSRPVPLPSLWVRLFSSSRLRDITRKWLQSFRWYCPRYKSWKAHQRWWPPAGRPLSRRQSSPRPSPVLD